MSFAFIRSVKQKNPAKAKSLIHPFVSGISCSIPGFYLFHFHAVLSNLLYDFTIVLFLLYTVLEALVLVGGF